MKQKIETVYLKGENEPESVIPRRMKKIAKLQKAYGNGTTRAGVFRKLIDNAVVPDKGE